MTSPTYIFIQYRLDMVFGDHSVIWALYYDTDINGVVQIDITDQMTTVPDEPEAEIQQTPNEKLTDVLLRPLRALIPMYDDLRPRDIFAVFAHNDNSDVHHAYDFLQAQKFIKKFELDSEEVVIMEFGVDLEGNVRRANRGRAQPFTEYFRKDIEQAATQSAE